MNLGYLTGAGAGELYRRAAIGDLSAQRQLADSALAEHRAAIEQGGLVEMAAVESVFWARLAASHGHDADAMRLAEALTITAHAFAAAQCADLAETLTVETIAILNVMAAQGHPEAIGALHGVAGDVAPELLRRGRDLAQAGA